MNADDYESLPTTSITINMTAGAIAGVMEHIIMYPMDSVKTRMQSFLPATSGYDISTTFRNMIKKEGLMRPIRGVTAVVAGAGPAHALYFASYEMTKELLTKFTKNNTFNYMASGATATIIHDAISIPTDVIKQRMQMYNSPYRTVIACVSNVYKTEGITAFYRSYSTQMVMNVPYTALQISTYEFVQNQLNQERKYNPPVHVLAGGCAGAVAAAATTPLDVVKTLLNTQETGLTIGMLEAIKKIHKMAGPRGFFKGLAARVLYSMPAVAICWSTYESFRFYLSGVSREAYKSTVTGKNSLKPRDPVSFVPEGTIVQAMEEYAPNDAYVFPNTDETEHTEIKSEKSSLAAAATQNSGPIKTVCDFSNSVTAPPLSLHTRHTDVKTPFDRSFRSP